MKKIALEGPINGCTDSECKNWRDEVIAKLGGRFTFHNPLVYDCRGREEETEQDLVKFDTAGIADSDIILVMANHPGWGTAMAVQMSWEQHKTIITICDNPKPSPWLKHRSSVIFSTLEKARDYIQTVLNK